MKYLILIYFIFLNACSSSPYAEPVRVDYQLNKFGNVAISNSPQFATSLIIKEKNQTLIHTRNLIKNIDPNQSYRVLLNKGYFLASGQKWDINCRTTIDEKTNDFELKAQKSAIIECSMVLNTMNLNKDLMIEAFLPIENNLPLQWSFILKAEDFK